MSKEKEQQMAQSFLEEKKKKKEEYCQPESEVTILVLKNSTVTTNATLNTIIVFFSLKNFNKDLFF